MTGAGVGDGDELVVDRSMRSRHGSIVVAILDGELTAKRLERVSAGVVLRAENPEYPAIHVPAMSDLQIWGAVNYRLPPRQCALSDASGWSTSTRST